MLALAARAEALERELLRALALAHLGRIEIALRVHREVVDRAELAGRAPALPELADDLAVVARERPHMVVLAVGVVQPGLGRVVREVDVPGRAAATGRSRDDELLQEGPVLLEDLDPVVRPVAHVEQAVLREPDAVHGVVERLHAGRYRRTAVRAPVTLVGPEIGRAS